MVGEWSASDLMFFSFLCQLEGKRYMELIGGLWRTLGFLGGRPMVKYRPNMQGILGLPGVRHTGLYMVYNGPNKNIMITSGQEVCP